MSRPRSQSYPGEHCRGNKKHLCKECGKGFPSRSKLDRHLRVHTGEKPFCCDVCGSRFTQNGSLKIHQKKHSGGHSPLSHKAVKNQTPPRAPRSPRRKQKTGRNCQAPPIKTEQFGNNNFTATNVTSASYDDIRRCVSEWDDSASLASLADSRLSDNEFEFDCTQQQQQHQQQQQFQPRNCSSPLLMLEVPYSLPDDDLAATCDSMETLACDSPDPYFLPQTVMKVLSCDEIDNVTMYAEDNSWSFKGLDEFVIPDTVQPPVQW